MGTYQDQTGQAGCKTASKGYYVQNATGRTYQTACPVGTFQDQTGQTSCKTANKGYYVNATGRTYQTACPVGTYQNSEGQSNCKTASKGYYVQNATGRTYQTACPVGTFQDQTGQTSCKTASRGHYVQNATGRTYQTACAAGSYQPSTGQTSCLSAPEGFFVAGTGMSEATECQVCTISYELTACQPTSNTSCAVCDDACPTCNGPGKYSCTTPNLVFSGGFDFVAPSILHRWSFTDDGKDSVGGATATLVNGATISGRTVSVDGADQYVELPIESTLSSLTSFTIELWVTMHNPGTWSRIFDFGANASVNFFMTPKDPNGRLRTAITTSGNGGEQRVIGGPDTPQGTATHIVFTLKSKTGLAVLYVNGRQAGTGDWSLNTAALGPLSNLWLGRSQYNDPYLEANYDEVRIYDGALSSQKVEQNYYRGADGL